MVAVAQLVEHLVVVQVVAGSSPVSHPKETATPTSRCRGLWLWVPEAFPGHQPKRVVLGGVSLGFPVTGPAFSGP